MNEYLNQAQQQPATTQPTKTTAPGPTKTTTPGPAAASSSTSTGDDMLVDTTITIGTFQNKSASLQFNTVYSYRYKSLCCTGLRRFTAFIDQEEERPEPKKSKMTAATAKAQVAPRAKTGAKKGQQDIEGEGGTDDEEYEPDGKDKEGRKGAKDNAATGNDKEGKKGAKDNDKKEKKAKGKVQKPDKKDKQDLDCSMRIPCHLSAV